MLENPAIYVHFPWCVRKCPYCDFNSHPLKTSTDFRQYTNALIDDWQAQTQYLESENLFASVFLGGGTPSLFAPQQIEVVLSELPLQASAEVTMEANPGTTEHADFSDYQRAGVNRLSIGAQSFDNHQLQQLGRIHSAAETANAFANARLGGFNNINIDLMWGLPQQSVAEALADLRAAIDLGAEHISWYQLTIEAKTEFAQRVPLLPKEQTLADIERLGLQLLADTGYLRYEVSAFALDGYRCKHNMNYWSFGDYIGIGAGAHGKISTRQDQYLTIARTSKASQPRLYLNQPRVTSESTVDEDALIVEFMMNALRLVEGVSWDTFYQRTGLAWPAVSATWSKLAAQGLLQTDKCAPTPQGMRYLDSVVSAFLTP